MRRTQQIGLLAVAAVAIVAAVVAVLLLRRSGGPFEGERAIDLGKKELHSEPAVWTGQFSLRNASAEAVHVLTLRPNCGCVQVELPRKVIPAGELLEIPFTMTLERHGRRTAYIDVILADERVLELRLDAEARETYRVTAAPSDVMLDETKPQSVALIVQVHDGENPPPAPVIEAPAGVTAEFTEWAELEGREMHGEKSRRWRGEINLSIDSAAGEFSDGELNILVGDKDSARVHIIPASGDGEP